MSKDTLREALEHVLRLPRGTSGRIILERFDEEKLCAALSQPTVQASLNGPTGASGTGHAPAQAEQREGWKLVPVEVLDRFPEINPSNYDHDDACALNAWGVEVVLAASPQEAPVQQGEAVDMVLYCPKCHTQHIDAPDERTPDWTNPPHKSHLCHGCGHVWRPSDTPTNGVWKIASGKDADTAPAQAAPQGEAVAWQGLTDDEVDSILPHRTAGITLVEYGRLSIAAAQGALQAKNTAPQPAAGAEGSHTNQPIIGKAAQPEPQGERAELISELESMAVAARGIHYQEHPCYKAAALLAASSGQVPMTDDADFSHWYWRACETSQPRDWMHAALHAQRVLKTKKPESAHGITQPTIQEHDLGHISVEGMDDTAEYAGRQAKK